MKKNLFFILLFLATSISSQSTIDQLTALANEITLLNGKIGIGITNPLEKLHVDGRQFLGVTPAGTGTWYQTSSTGGNWFAGLTSNNSWRIYKGTNKFLINADGNIGIGTSSPMAKLDVNGLIKIRPANNLDNISPGLVYETGNDFLYDNQYINHYGFGFHGYNDGLSGSPEPINAYVAGYFGVDFFTNGTNRLRISRDGIVSIGSVTRQVGYKLAVNGKIKAKEIKVETGWADFVFYKDYNLPSLKEVEQHIKEKGHLKDIPSAKEVEKNGIFLGQMDSKLLQKIEELTLYTIAQEKKIKEQKLKLEKEKKRNDNLEKRLEKLEQLLLKK